ncbi:FHA domain-containing protein [Arcobacter arenosus]|uniref:FHA domain-containing protein n=1 Tax=Arcobacter arenosus TaxID=2576037 RepID=UPI003BA94DB5
MQELKKEILKSIVPRAVLFPMNEKAKASIANEKLISITRFPYKIGRESRVSKNEKGFFVIDRGSMNGTTINSETIGGNRKITKKEIKDGDKIKIGSKESIFCLQNFKQLFIDKIYFSTNSNTF